MVLDHGNAVSPERLDEDQAPPIPSFSRSPFLETPLGQPDDNTMESEGVLDPEDIMKDEEVLDQEEEVVVNIGHSIRPSSVDSLVMRTTEMSGKPRMSNTAQLPVFSRSPTAEAPLGQTEDDIVVEETILDPILDQDMCTPIRQTTELSASPRMPSTPQRPLFSRSPTSEAPLGQGKGDTMLLDTVSEQERFCCPIED